MTAFETLARVEPAWLGLTTAAEALSLGKNELLHAGPPFAHPCEIPAVLRNSAAQCCVQEGWAEGIDEAYGMIDSGDVALHPAQDRNVATPLAEIVSPSTTLQYVRCALDSRLEAWSPLTSGASALPRFGTADPGVQDSMRFRDRDLYNLLRPCFAEPIPLKPIARAGLEGGDDLHARTDVATSTLAEVLAGRLGNAVAKGRGEEFFTGTPLFFLSLWMAACKVMLRSIEGLREPGAGTLVTTIAANGRAVGIKLAADPKKWVVGPAVRPEGPRIPGKEAPTAGHAVGDSAIVDALGFGGQALHLAPQTVAALEAYLPKNWKGHGHAALGPEALAFPGLILPIGLDAAKVSNGTTPIMLFGMLDETGVDGLLGRGVFLPDAAVFEKACMAL